MKITFDSWEEFDELYYACREAEIRFKRLRTQVKNGVPSPWTEEDCNAKIAQYRRLQDKVAAFDPSVTECEGGLTDDRFRLIVEE